jgi:hypothetical protein
MLVQRTGYFNGDGAASPLYLSAPSPSERLMTSFMISFVPP